VRPRTLLLFALVALLGAVAAVLPALATASEAKLEVNENCVQPNWPCWATPGSSQPAFKTTIASGGTVTFVDQKTAANIAWTSTPSGPPTCSSEVPVAPASPKTGWEGKCTFNASGTYKFESSTLFKDYSNDYTKYEIVVGGTPTDKTTSASGETQTEAMLNGSINPAGNTVEYHFEYEGPGVAGKQPTPTATLSAADFTSHPVSAQVTGLEPGMTYHFLLVATYGAGKTVAGATTQTFTTHAVTAPTATTLAAEGFKETEATLKGTVNPGGEATEYFFEYGTDTHYGQKTEKATVSASAGNQTVSATLTKLAPGTEYHFRLVAKNALEEVHGLDQMFTTLSPPPPPTTTTSIMPPTTATHPATTPTTLVEPPPGPPIVGGPSLRSTQRGTSVKGSLNVSQAGGDGRLEVDLYAKSASLARAGHSKQVRVGRLVRASVSAGRVSFSVALTARGKRALTRHRHLALTVKITLTPVRGAPVVSVTRNVVLRT
jgi:hypothetical protein